MRKLSEYSTFNIFAYFSLSLSPSLTPSLPILHWIKCGIWKKKRTPFHCVLLPIFIEFYVGWSFGYRICTGTTTTWQNRHGQSIIKKTSMERIQVAKLHRTTYIFIHTNTVGDDQIKIYFIFLWYVECVILHSKRSKLTYRTRANCSINHVTFPYIRLFILDESEI